MNRIAATAAASLLALAVASPAAAQFAVLDGPNTAQTIKSVQNGITQVKEMQKQYEQMTSMAKTIGQNGPLAIAGDVIKKAGLDYADKATSPLKEYRAAMPGLLDALPGSTTGSSLGVTTGMAEQAKTSIEAGRKFALTAFYKSGNATENETAQRQGVRDAAMRDSVTSGYAMAVYTKNNLGQTETTMKALTDGVSGAKDLRGDVQSNSAIALAQLQQMTVQSQLLSQLLEVQSSTAMSGVGASIAP